MTCRCGHRDINHHYNRADHANTGRCLVLGCRDCLWFEDKEGDE